ncbi:xylulokinase [Winslowiella iniecta]|uniref:Xylulose kinase n=1 Tax=Winslowiella iniecta TaxID=1560201 RepID=A0A0L7THD1_9GAMM|nr:xylulokinase [Winslowiella iniecta]KOC89239.1 xylulose kinase [Winslowiella iniecta]KOC94808.1 xylulose kinase [Winslowiella iniecta]
MYLGIDAGTSEIKALVLNSAGEIMATAGAPLTLQRPHPHWSEQDPAQWWQATQQVIDQLRQQLGASWCEIRAIGLSGQMHGAVLLGQDNEVLRPCILWNDTRSAAECQQLNSLAPELHAVAGNLAMPGFTAPKLLWLARHEPTIFNRIATVLLPKDYLRWMMSGEKISEMSDAAGTLWLDVAQRQWSASLLAACGLTREQMPRLVEGSHPAGKLKAEVARQWGLSDEVMIAGGGGDNAASAVGIGAINPGDAFISLGTSGVLFAVNDGFRPDPQSALHAFCHALPQRWHQMSVMLSAASALRWLCDLLQTSETALLAEVAALSHEEQLHSPLFLPYLSGERTPHNDPQACGAFHGLTHASQRASLAYAVLEGVSFGMADGLRVLQQAGTELTCCSLIGGGARSPWWAQLMADVLNLTIITHRGGEAGGALGAARLGWLAVGGDEQQVCQKPAELERYLPDASRHQQLQPRLQQFRQLYQQQRAMRL